MNVLKVSITVANEAKCYRSTYCELSQATTSCPCRQPPRFQILSSGLQEVRLYVKLTITVKPILHVHLCSQLASYQSPDEGFSIVFTSIKGPATFKQKLSISRRVAV